MVNNISILTSMSSYSYNTWKERTELELETEFEFRMSKVLSLEPCYWAGSVCSSVRPVI